ncbi:hypothetical protein PRCB_19665 [Pantoea rodasii]|uniref:Uncharacterized protein n=1 Tax=Pantoea rodasii TaxID=1076549 RepID=A0A2M9W7I6_9GAMM|nr:hypothetical protein PRCB_19665 [Pantoea rodasii]
MPHLRFMYASYFKLLVRWLLSFTRITYFSKLIGIISLAAFLQHELFCVSVRTEFGNDEAYYICSGVRQHENLPAL